MGYTNTRLNKMTPEQALDATRWIMLIVAFLMAALSLILEVRGC